MNNEDNWSSFIIILLLIILFSFNYYSYGKFVCPTCPTCPPIKECLSCPVPSSQGLINYIINTFMNDISKATNTKYEHTWESNPRPSDIMHAIYRCATGTLYVQYL